MTDIQSLVAENRQSSRRIEGNFIEVGDRGRGELSFARNLFVVEVGVEVYVRELNDGLYSGHPNGSEHGSGNGVAGDVRGGWNLVASSTESETWTRLGRNTVRDLLRGQSATVGEIAIGRGSSPAGSSDTSLDDETTRTDSAWERGGGNVVEKQGLFGFATHDGTVTEFGIFDLSGDLLGRATTTDINPSLEQEVRVSVVLTVEGEGTGTAVVTDDGEAAVADAIRSENTTVGLQDYAWGTGTTTFSKSDSSLSNEVYRQGMRRTAGLETLDTESVIPPEEPSGSLPVTLSELGVFDNQGRMVYATTFSPFTKPASPNEIPLYSTVAFLFV